MPLHEYECDACGHRFERIQKFSDPPIDVCPKCGSPVRKLISSPAFQFKGTGFYITDYPKKDSSNAGKGGESKEAGGKDSGGKDAKDSGTSSGDTKTSESKGEGKSSGKPESASSSSSSSSSKDQTPKPKA